MTLSPHLVKLIDARARLRPDKSRSAAIERILEEAELERQVREYYAGSDSRRDADDAFWDEVRLASAKLDANDARHARSRR